MSFQIVADLKGRNFGFQVDDARNSFKTTLQPRKIGKKMGYSGVFVNHYDRGFYLHYQEVSYLL